MFVAIWIDHERDRDLDGATTIALGATEQQAEDNLQKRLAEEGNDSHQYATLEAAVEMGAITFFVREVHYVP